MTTLKINQLTKRFGRKTILDNLTFQIKENKIYGLLGRNGVGKSTLLNIINNRNFPTTGEVLLDHDSINNNSVALQQMYLMSETNMYAKRTRVCDMFRLADDGYGKFNFALAHRLTKDFGVNEKARLSNLSTGLTTIAKLITALCVNANFIFLDEPTLGLDAGHRELFYRELMKTYEERPRTFILSTHLISEIQPLVEHVWILDHHRLIRNESVDDLLANAYAISGPAELVDEFTDGLTVLDHQTISNIKTAYVVQPLDETKVIPDRVKIEHIDLQKAFMALTNGEEN
ncbi:ABC transporter ATP-binding protein [uncultured Limosilactobacillus sp.]|uniref:ATP-binding cassette domain-containing protein n=1 Tax=uncultured Limosilactobacillus sp. TaxID=2837629 RepID=UPI0025EE1384|nr:ABC transporter ATP-binding protein [uncultured Limosilactobacillus sp.]